VDLPAVVLGEKTVARRERKRIGGEEERWWCFSSVFRRTVVVRRHGSDREQEREREWVFCWSRVKRSNGEDGVLKEEGRVNAERTRLFTSLDVVRVVSVLTRVV